MKVQLRPYQNQGVGDIRESIRRGRRAPLYVLPTGGGKTPIAAYIIESAYKRGTRVYFLVHRSELLLQASRHLFALGIPHGCVSPSHSMSKDIVQVASVQTLVNRLDRYPEPGLIIVDEGHHANAETWRKITRAYPKAIVLGVTATPALLSGKGLGVEYGGVYDDLVLGPSAEWLMSEGWLTRAEVYAPENALDLTGVKVVGGDYAKGELGRRVDKPSITGSAVEHYAKICPGTPAIAFCASVAHAQHVADEFKASGFKALCLDGSLSAEQRKKAIEDLGNGKLHVLSSCMIVSEGTDIPVVGAIILLRPTMSLALHLQQIGRGLRPVFPAGFDPNTATAQERLAAIARSVKPAAIVLDHVGNTMRPGLGLPEDDREWTLEGIKKKKKKKDEEEQGQDIKIKQCPKCFRCHVPGPVCPSCGHVYEVQYREVEQVEGSLRKITDEEREAMRAAKKKEVGRARSLTELVILAKSRGYKVGWIANILKIRGQSVDWKAINEAWQQGGQSA